MIVSIDDLPKIRRKHKNQIIVLAGGVFDLMHPGHLDLFNKMRASGDVVVIAVTSDKRVKEKKGHNRPIHDEKTRLIMVDAVKQIDYALVAPRPYKTQTEVPSVQLMRKLQPDIFVSSEKAWLNHTAMFEKLNVKFKLIPRFSPYISTTRTVKKVVRRYTKKP